MDPGVQQISVAKRFGHGEVMVPDGHILPGCEERFAEDQWWNESRMAVIMRLSTTIIVVVVEPNCRLSAGEVATQEQLIFPHHSR